MTGDRPRGQGVAAGLGEALLARSLTLATAESCTGGLIGHLLTNVPGASAWYAGGVTAYANSAKTGVLGVGEDVLAAHGAVSAEAVTAMAAGARRLFGAGCALAVSGIAGPTGGTPEKPVGTVYIARDVGGKLDVLKLSLDGTREEIKVATARAAMEFLARGLA